MSPLPSALLEAGEAVEMWRLSFVIVHAYSIAFFNFDIGIYNMDV